ncbi:MAG: hypothetical protein EA428_12145 [Spirochaetaceae bacterium]|nr:MAG: hypothetical protein EA428_12145 [Spirochaetaceae bacterium]
MKRTPADRPQVLIPYPGPSDDAHEQDVFVYLRPESNGVLVESTMLKVVEHHPDYKQKLKLVYLANMPGKYILDEHIIENHYQLKLYFAVHGPKAFTPAMAERFTAYFDTPFEAADVVGSFEALKRLHMRPDDLFRVWVPANRMLAMNGQTVKLVHDMYVVNYDMPAILHKNNRNTDIAVMMFRTSLGFAHFKVLAGEMANALAEAGLVDERTPPSRLFHYSKGPFEHILDGLGYLCFPDGRRAEMHELSYARYLHAHGLGYDDIYTLLRNPIACFERADGVSVEEDLLAYTMFDSYQEALSKVQRMRSQYYRQHS